MLFADSAKRKHGYEIVVGMMKEWFRNVFKAAANITGVINVKNNTYLNLRLS